MRRATSFFVLLVILMTMFSVGYGQNREQIVIDVGKSHDKNIVNFKTGIKSTGGIDIILKGIPALKPKGIEIKVNNDSFTQLSEIKKGTDPVTKKPVYYISIIGNELQGNGKNINISWPLKLSVKYDGEDVLKETEIRQVRMVELLKEPVPFYDAIALAEAINEKDDRILEILKKYTTESLENIKDAKKVFDKNTFLIEYMKDVNELQSIVKKAKDRGLLNIHSLTTPAAGLSATKLAEGIAKFLVERTKKELSIAIFQNFKKELEKEKYDILKTLFPETFAILQIIDTEIYTYSSYLQMIRETFEKDLSNMFSSLGNVLEKEKIKKLFSSDKEWLRIILKAAFDIIDGLKKEKHPGDILAEFDAEKLKDNTTDDKLKNLRNAVKLLQVISGSLKEKTGSGRYWIDKDSLKELFKWDEKQKGYFVFNLYLGLIYEQSKSKDIKFKIGDNEIALADELIKLKEVSNKIEDIKKQIEEFVTGVNIVENSIKGLKQAQQNDQKTYEDYYKAYNTVLDTIEYVLPLGEHIVNKKELPGSKVSFDDSRIKTFTEIARKLGDIYLDIKRKEYSMAVFNVIRVADGILQLSGYKQEQIETEPKLSLFRKIRSTFLKYGAFMAGVARAENSDEVKKMIESAALPVGSYRIKRTNPFTISLNSYVGFLGGQENYLAERGKDKEWKENMAVTAPIGLAFNFGLKSKGKYVSSFSFFASIIDLGAIVRYYFEKDENGTVEEKGLSTITWKDIFSPGAFLIWGPKNLPVSFGLGVQLAPDIKKVYNDGTIERIPSRIRWGLMIGVDIPLIHFK